MSRKRMQKNPVRKSKIDELAKGLYSGAEQRN
ncbi:N-acetylglutamate synthase, partial [Vibrio sp. 10N.222.48.A3]